MHYPVPKRELEDREPGGLDLEPEVFAVRADAGDDGPGEIVEPQPTEGRFHFVLVFPPADYDGLVIIRPPDRATTAMVLSLVEQSLKDSKVMANLPGRLLIIEPGRIRCRPVI